MMPNNKVTEQAAHMNFLVCKVSYNHDRDLHNKSYNSSSINERLRKLGPQ
jgi:hypothetical protein